MNTERKNTGKGIWALPFLLALPFLAAVVFAALRFGPKLMQLVHAAVKAVVVP